jgi:uncharacterized protein (TIGR00290 family)
MGLDVLYLLNMKNTSGHYSRSHGIRSSLLEKQGESMCLSLIQRRASWRSYEHEFKKALKSLKNEGIEAGVFGDIDLEPHRQWVERVCQETGLKPILPLWNENRQKLIQEFITSGFKAVILAVKSEVLSPQWLGREIDVDFLRDIKKMANIDPCGEKGEYHTFVYDGPIFRNPVSFSYGRITLRKKYCFLSLNIRNDA